MSANSLIYLVRPARFELATSRFVVIKQGVSGFRRCCLIVVTVSKMAFQGTVSLDGTVPCFVLFTIQ